MPSASGFLTAKQRAHLLANYDAVYDSEFGGWGGMQKFIHADSLDYALARAGAGDETLAARARRTLDAGRALIEVCPQAKNPGSVLAGHPDLAAHGSNRGTIVRTAKNCRAGNERVGAGGRYGADIRQCQPTVDLESWIHA